TRPLALPAPSSASARGDSPSRREDRRGRGQPGPVASRHRLELGGAVLTGVAAEMYLGGQQERERRPFAEDTVAGDPPAMGLDDLLRDGEPETGAHHRRGILVVRLIELLEDVRQLVGRDARAAVAP